MLSKQCPQCHHSLSLDQLKSSGHHKAFIKRQVFLCPNCETPIQLPARAEKILSIGILCSIIFAPLSYYWLETQLLSFLLFTNGAILILIGSFKNKLRLARPQTGKPEDQESLKEKNNNE